MAKKRKTFLCGEYRAESVEEADLLHQIAQAGKLFELTQSMMLRHAKTKVKIQKYSSRPQRMIKNAP